MSDDNIKIKKYISGCFGQIIIIAILTYFLRRNGLTVDYSTLIGIACIIVGGCSSALWGGIVSVKYSNRTIFQIISDFFNVKKAFYFYPVIILLLGIDFSSLLFGGHLIASNWYSPFLIFLKAILFGGIEEIGWRYTLQPILEKKSGFLKAVLTIFFLWGIWHFLYFYIDGSLSQINAFGFYTGLLTNCFLLGMIYKKTSSLWLCVSTHALINTLSQIFIGGNDYVGYASKIIIILIACKVCLRNKENTL